MGPCPVPQPPHDRLRPARRSADARGTGRDIRRRTCRRRRRNRRPPATPPPLMHALIEPWRHGFMQRALLELVLIGVLTGVLGCWIVLYELSYSTESLAHALFPGLVAAALLGLPLLAGAAGGLAVAAVAVALAGTFPTIGRDTAVAIV